MSNDIFLKKVCRLPISIFILVYIGRSNLLVGILSTAYLFEMENDIYGVLTIDFSEKYSLV